MGVILFRKHLFICWGRLDVHGDGRREELFLWLVLLAPAPVRELLPCEPPLVWLTRVRYNARRVKLAHFRNAQLETL